MRFTLFAFVFCSYVSETLQEVLLEKIGTFKEAFFKWLVLLGGMGAASQMTFILLVKL